MRCGNSESDCPWFDAQRCGNDPYWNTGTVPRAITYKGKRRCDVCGTDCSETKTINGAIIDLNEALMKQLTGSTLSTFTNALWRFS